MSSTAAHNPADLTSRKLPSEPLHVITAASPSTRERVAELWQSRELLWFLVMRDLKLRYKQTVLGGLWAILQPAAMVTVFVLVFRKIPGISPAGIPYPLFLTGSLIIWVYISNALSGAAMSMIQAGNANLITKTYFPRLLIPIAAALVPLVDMAFSFLLLAGVLIYYRYPVGPQIILVIPLTALAMMLVIGAGAWLAALNVKYRDVRYVLPFFVQLWLFASPVMYSYTLSPNWQMLLGFNPATGLLEAYRSAIFAQDFDTALIALSTALIAATFASGIYFFYRIERELTDII